MPPISDEDLAKLKTEHETSAKAKDDEIAKMKADIEKFTKEKNPPDEKGLEEKARLERESKTKKDAESKSLEAALRFSLGSKDWLKTNASLLPKEIESIFTAAEKETYGNAMEKDSAIKTGIIQEFFKLQANVDLLTAGPKSALEDFLKLTKTGKEERAQSIFDSVFEPAFEMLRQVKKAQQLNNGSKNQDAGDKAFADRLMNLSKKHYLGEK